MWVKMMQWSVRSGIRKYSPLFLDNEGRFQPNSFLLSLILTKEYIFLFVLFCFFVLRDSGSEGVGEREREGGRWGTLRFVSSSMHPNWGWRWNLKPRYLTLTESLTHKVQCTGLCSNHGGSSAREIFLFISFLLYPTLLSIFSSPPFTFNEYRYSLSFGSSHRWMKVAGLYTMVDGVPVGKVGFLSLVKFWRIWVST